jgi:hypothetical protein
MRSSHHLSPARQRAAVPPPRSGRGAVAAMIVTYAHPLQALAAMEEAAIVMGDPAKT